MANLAFGVEERVENYVGNPVEREEFREPTLRVVAVNAGPAVDDESVELENPGDAPLDMDGWELEAVFEEAGRPTTSTLHTFGDVEAPPGETVTVYTGTRPPGEGDADRERYAGWDSDVWGSAGGSVTVLRAGSEDEDDHDRFVTMETVFRPDESLPDYRLATSVPDHWFPLQPVRPKTGNEADPADRDTYRLALSLLLDADSMDDPHRRLPSPEGRILDTPDPLGLYEEEVTRSGREVERHYQLARWTDGSTHLWSSRRTSNGRGEAASRLRYDVLSDADPG
jgi:hypothetical protein